MTDEYMVDEYVEHPYYEHPCDEHTYYECPYNEHQYNEYPYNEHQYNEHQYSEYPITQQYTPVQQAVYSAGLFMTIVTNVMIIAMMITAVSSAIRGIVSDVKDSRENGDYYDE